MNISATSSSLPFWVSGPVVGLAGPMFHFSCPVPVQVRTITHAHRETYRSHSLPVNTCKTAAAVTGNCSTSCPTWVHGKSRLCLATLPVLAWPAHATASVHRRGRPVQYWHRCSESGAFITKAMSMFLYKVFCTRIAFPSPDPLLGSSLDSIIGPKSSISH